MLNDRTLLLSKTSQTTQNFGHKFFFPAQYCVPVISNCMEILQFVFLVRTV